jgi:large subunit ribosomal protein L18|tara:strand:- start:6592 stop:6945 length:354 start_codon:yes stop_codon:yes gene_type:complete
MNSKKQARKKVRLSIRSKISGTSEIPRLAVYRSNKQIYAQIIDDTVGKTLTAASSNQKKLINTKGTKIDQAIAVGKSIAENAKSVGVESVVFDRGGFLYHGRVKALAESARETGLKF